MQNKNGIRPDSSWEWSAVAPFNQTTVAPFNETIDRGSGPTCSLFPCWRPLMKPLIAPPVLFDETIDRDSCPTPLILLLHKSFELCRSWQLMLLHVSLAGGTMNGFIEGLQGSRGKGTPHAKLDMLGISPAICLREGVAIISFFPNQIGKETPWFLCLYFGWFRVDPFDNSTSSNVEQEYKINT